MILTMFSQILLRVVLVAIPFLIWFAWAAWARRSGRPMGTTPWPWLEVASALILAASLMGTVAFKPDNRGKVYVPGEVTADGRVTPGRFEAK
jgi:hypothetical protein